MNTGLFGTKSTFVPLRDATDDGDTLRVPYDKAKVKDAPNMDADGELSQSEESGALPVLRARLLRPSARTRRLAAATRTAARGHRRARRLGPEHR